MDLFNSFLLYLNSFIGLLIYFFYPFLYQKILIVIFFIRNPRFTFLFFKIYISNFYRAFKKLFIIIPSTPPKLDPINEYITFQNQNIRYKPRTIYKSFLTFVNLYKIRKKYKKSYTKYKPRFNRPYRKMSIIRAFGRNQYSKRLHLFEDIEDNQCLNIETKKFNVRVGKYLSTIREIEYRCQLVQSSYFDYIMLKIKLEVLNCQLLDANMIYSCESLDRIYDCIDPKELFPPISNLCGECNQIHEKNILVDTMCMKNIKTPLGKIKILEYCDLIKTMNENPEDFPPLLDDIINIILQYAWFKPEHYLESIPDPIAEGYNSYSEVMPFGFIPNENDKKIKIKLLPFYSLLFVTTYSEKFLEKINA